MSKTKLTFEQSMNRLNEIVRLLEGNTIQLDESMKLFEEGLKLSQDCQEQLDQYQNQLSSMIESQHDETSN